MNRATNGTCDAVVIGSGFGGMYMLKRLRDELGMSVRVFEAGDGVGGTWYWNRYPGARCDAESIFYSYSFDPELEQEWTWTERFSSQPEILAYANFVADRHDLRKDITFCTRVIGAEWDDDLRRWTVALDTGESVTSRYVVTAVGCLSASQVPSFAGQEDFAGRTYHTGLWPHEGVDVRGKRVAVIGTGSSGIQSIPVLARDAAQLTVFQRTPNYSVPARNRPLDDAEVAAVKARYPQLREECRHSGGGAVLEPAKGPASSMTHAEQLAELHRRWDEGGPGFISVFEDLITDGESNEIAAQFVRDRIAETVHDPHVADLLTPTDYPIGTKRICVDTDYFDTYNRDNVTLVSVKDDPIERISRDGVVVGGTEYPVDIIVFATGFDAMTGPYTRIDIRGREGRSLREKWAAGPRLYLGLAGAGFPNLYTITGPGSPSVLSNMTTSIEQHVDWITDYLRFQQEGGIEVAEADQEAEDRWVEHTAEVAARTLYPRAASWYMGANIPGKPRIFMPYVGGVGPYREICDQIAADGYRGFAHSEAAEPVAVG